jgi:hypothetical protein
MAGNADNILIGAAQVDIDGTDVGFTKGGTTVRYEPEFIDVMADQAVGVVRKARSLERMFVTTTLLEVTLEQIRLSFMQPATHLVGGSVLTLGYNDSCFVDELAIVLTGPGPGTGGLCGTRVWTFPKCISFGTKEVAMTREEETSFEVEFEILKDANGNFGTVVDQ